MKRWRLNSGTLTGVAQEPFRRTTLWRHPTRSGPPVTWHWATSFTTTTEYAPATGRIWTEERTTPDGLVGWVSYEFTTGDWVATAALC